jgi:dipeptidyl aminopeptidase/acylaminoacyl peptidase
VYSPSGHLVYHREPLNAGLWAVKFSLEKLEVTGEPFLAIPNVALGTVSRDGTLVYAQGGTTRRARLAFCDRTGRIERTIGAPQDLQSFMALAPDGERVAIRTNGEDPDVWIVDTTRETQTRFTFTDSREAWPSWSPDGALLYFQNTTLQPCTTFVKRADGTGEIHRVMFGGNGYPTPDGSRFVYTLFDEAKNSYSLWSVPLGADGLASGEPSAFLPTNSIYWEPRVSPDGNFIAYCSLESGRNQIYLKRFPSGDGKWQVTVDTGFWPHWRGDSKELYFATDAGVFAVSVGGGGAPVLGTPTLLFARPGKIATMPNGWPDVFDVTPDGNRFLIMVPADTERTERTPALVVVENWASTLHVGK